MAKLEIPVVIDGVKSIEELANLVLDDYEYKGKTIREWADRIANPETNADRIRAMSDEEMAEFLFYAWNNASWCSSKPCPEDQSCEPCWLDWLQQEVMP